MYKYYALVVNTLVGNDHILNFDEWYIYGKELIPSTTPPANKFRLLELENNKLDKIHILDTDLKYDGTGDSNITYTVTPTSNINVDILVVGGGGGGGLAGAGGADVEYIQNYELSAGTEYTFKVGKGGSVGNIGGPSEMTSNLTNLYKVLGGGNGGSLTIGSTITEVFEYGGAVETWTKPEGVKEVTAYVWGAGGGGMGYGNRGKTSYAGGGGFVKATLNVSGLSSLILVVGGGGDGSTSTGSARDGGFLDAGDSTSTNYHLGGSGGGLSGIFKNDLKFVITSGVLNTNAEAFIIAGGGGGAGDNGTGGNSNGGGGGGGGAGGSFTNGKKGQDRKQNNSFLSNTGGDYGTYSTFKYSAGDGSYGAGSGSGYYGGLFDSDNENVGLPGGGGGSSYWGGSGVSYIGDIGGTHNTNSQQSYSSLVSFNINANIGIGAPSIDTSTNIDGGNGLIVLEYTPTKPSPPIASATSGG